MEEAEMYANTDVKKIGDWSEQNKIQFNEVKSKVLLVTRKIREQLVFTYLNNKTLEQVQEIKYLGIIFDSKLLFNKHIQYVSDRCITLINVLAKSAKLNWGLGHQALKTIYKGAILPMLLYGALVYLETQKYY